MFAVVYLQWHIEKLLWLSKRKRNSLTDGGQWFLGIFLAVSSMTTQTRGTWFQQKRLLLENRGDAALKVNFQANRLQIHMSLQVPTQIVAIPEPKSIVIQSNEVNNAHALATRHFLIGRHGTAMLSSTDNKRHLTLVKSKALTKKLKSFGNFGKKTIWFLFKK